MSHMYVALCALMSLLQRDLLPLELRLSTTPRRLLAHHMVSGYATLEATKVVLRQYCEAINLAVGDASLRHCKPSAATAIHQARALRIREELYDAEEILLSNELD